MLVTEEEVEAETRVLKAARNAELKPLRERLRLKRGCLSERLRLRPESSRLQVRLNANV